MLPNESFKNIPMTITFLKALKIKNFIIFYKALKVGRIKKLYYFCSKALNISIKKLTACFQPTFNYAIKFQALNSSLSVISFAGFPFMLWHKGSGNSQQRTQ